ncbi:MAG: DUF1624 domain-containing protein [Syntrophaceae bacterium]|nr:DUF1624 domain-containing protein [Syntrophaceae bacterium]
MNGSEVENITPGRVLSVDVMRGFALICMVMVHFMVYLVDAASADTWPYFFLNHILADWGASCFLMMMGMSQVLSARRHAGEDNRLIFKRTMIRGGFIFLAGIVMLALAWGPGRIWQWDILTLMGFATVMLFFCRFLPSWAILFLAVSLAVCTPLLRMGIDFNAVWGGNFVHVPVISRYLPGILLDPAAEYEPAWQAGEIVRGFLFTGEFPVVPWFIFPPLGFVLGRRIVSSRLRQDLPFLSIIGLLLIALGLGWAYAAMGRPGASVVFDYIAPLSFYPDSFTMICYQLGVALVVFSGLYYCYDVHRTDKQKESFLVRVYLRTSRSSLTFYFLHYLLIGWPLALVYLVTGRYLKYGFLGSIPTLLWGFTVVVLLELLLVVWGNHGNQYSLEWFLGALTKRFASS